MAPQTSVEDPPFGALLKRYRVAAGLSQEALAERAGMSVRGISDLERGVRHAPYRDTVTRLAAALELDETERATLEQSIQRLRRTPPRRHAPAAATAGTRKLADLGFSAVVEEVDREPTEGIVYGGEADGQACSQELPVGGFLGARPSSAMVDREGELAQILLTADTVAGGAGRLLLLAGEAGAGKTRLAQEVTLVVRDRGFLLAAGSCFESRQSVPYYPFLDVLASLYGVAPSALRSGIPERWPHLVRLLPEAGMARPPPSESHNDQEWLFRAITAFVQAIAQERPVAIFLDDLHWADQSSLDLLQHLARQTRGAPILLLGMYRDEEVGRGHALESFLTELHRQALVGRIAVPRLGREGTAALIASILGEHQISPELVSLIHDQTEGNAFFTQEVMRALMERGDIFQRDGVWNRREVREIEVPESIRAVITQRLSRLPPESQEVLRTASVLGQRFAFDDLAGMLSAPEKEVEEALETSASTGLVRELDRDSYGFNHALTQQALYSELSSRRKRRLHLAAGEALERSSGIASSDRRGKRATELAWHFREAGDAHRALAYSLLAGDQAGALFANRDAEQHYRTALDLARETEDQPRLAEASFKLGMALWGTGSLDEAIPLLEQAAALYATFDDPVMEGRARQVMASAYGVKRLPERRAEAFEQVEGLLDRIAERPPSRDQVLFYHVLTRAYDMTFGNSRSALVTAERGIEAARALGDERLLARMKLRQAGALGMAGRVREAVTVAERVQRYAEATGDVDLLAEALQQAAEFSMLAGEFERSRSYREREVEARARQGDAFEHPFALTNLAEISLYQGEWQAARRYAEEALARGEEIEHAMLVRFAQVWLGQLALLEGDWEAARTLLEKAAANPAGTAQIHRYIQRALAQLDILLGQPETALARLEPIIREAEPDGNDRTYLLPIVAWALFEAGNGEQAAKVAAEAVERGKRQDYALALVDALRVQGMALARQGKEAEAEQVFEEAVRLAQRMPYPFAEGQALYQWGLANLARGDRAKAQDRLAAALAIFHWLGANPWITRVEQTLGHRVGS